MVTKRKEGREKPLQIQFTTPRGESGEKASEMKRLIEARWKSCL